MSSNSKIEQIIEDIYEYLDGCKPLKLYVNKIGVDKDEILDLLEELRQSVPDEIRRYQKVITNRDNILSEAQQRAETMVSQAQAKTDQLLDESEIMQAAYTRAEEIMRQANQEATSLLEQASHDSDEMRRSALIYTNDLLADAKRNIEQGLANVQTIHANYQDALKNSIQIIDGNIGELMASLGEKPAPTAQSTQPVERTQSDSTDATDTTEGERLEPVPAKTEVLELDEDAFVKEDL